MDYIQQRIKSFKYAFEGIWEVLQSQANPKIHLTLAVVVVMAGYYLGLTQIEWCLIILCIALVLSAETFNTSIEHLTNLVSPEYHLLAKKTKDAAAGAVLWVAMGVCFVGIIIFLPKIVAML